MDQNNLNTPNPAAEQEVSNLVNSAFGKALAAAILAQFPICSILAIIFGSKGLKLLKEAKELAARYGISVSGKAIPTKILGLYGKIVGIVLTVIYVIYFFVIVMGIASSMFMYY